MDKAVEVSYDTFENNETRLELCPIVMMHGLFWNKFMLRDIARKLNEVTHRKVFSLDLRNHGESPSCEDCDFYLMAEDIKRFLDDKVLTKVAFVCQSFSGTIATLVGLERPEVVEKMVLVDSPPFYEYSDTSVRLLVQPQVTTQNRLLNLLDPKMTLTAAKTKFYKLAEISPEPAQEYFYKKAAYDLTKKNGKFKWKIDLDFLMEKYKQRAFAIEARGSSDHEMLLIRCPESQRVSDSKFETVLKFNPNAKLVTIEDTTHLLMFEKPEEFIEIVKDFLRTRDNVESAVNKPTPE